MNLTQQSRIIALFSILIVLATFTSTPAFGRELNAGVIELDKHIEQGELIRINQQVTATVTIYVNLPIVEQNALTATPVPLNNDSQAGSENGTPTPTPIPVQTGSVNLPIVVGALAIILVIILAWFFVGYLPARNKG